MRACPVCLSRTLHGNSNRCFRCGVVTKCPACRRGVQIRDGVYAEHNVDALAEASAAGRCITSGARSEVR